MLKHCLYSIVCLSLKYSCRFNGNQAKGCCLMCVTCCMLDTLRLCSSIIHSLTFTIPLTPAAIDTHTNIDFFFLLFVLRFIFAMFPFERQQQQTIESTFSSYAIDFIFCLVNEILVKLVTSNHDIRFCPRKIMVRITADSPNSFYCSADRAHSTSGNTEQSNGSFQ